MKPYPVEKNVPAEAGWSPQTQPPLTKLPLHDKLVLGAWGLFLAQLAAPIGSALYFLFLQRSWMYQDPHEGTTTYWGLKDTYDRLVVHLQNLFHNQMFGITTQSAPPWWENARHDFRHVLIGVIIAILVSSVTIGLGKRKRASKTYMALSFPLAFVAAAVVSAPLIWLDTLLPNDLGLHTGNIWLDGWLGKGTLQLTIIGVITGLVVKKLVLARTMDTIQLMSIDKNLAQGDREKWWWKLVFPPTYRKRFASYQERYDAGEYEPLPHGKAIGFALTLGTPVFLALLAFGVWLLYFGPAAGA